MEPARTPRQCALNNVTDTTCSPCTSNRSNARGDGSSSKHSTITACAELAGSGIGVTMQYPEARWDKHLPKYYRGAPVLVKGEDGRERCVSCQLCEFICPARAITITPGPIQEGPWGKVEKAPREFQIDMLRCIYCGMCEEACPEQAIFMSHNYLFTPTDKTQAIHNKAKLYELGGTRKGLVNKWNQYK